MTETDINNGEASKNLFGVENGKYTKQNNENMKNNNLKAEETHFDDVIRLSRDNKRLEKKVYGLAIVVVAGNILLIIVIATLYGVLGHTLSTHSHKPNVGEQIARILHQEPLCIRCDTIQLGPSPQEDDMLNNFARKQISEEEMCCIETPGQLLKMIDMAIERRYREELAKGNIIKLTSINGGKALESKPAAHLLGPREIPKNPGVHGGQFPIPNWIYKEDISFVTNLIYRNGRLVVPTKGLYFVYSQISFIEFYNTKGQSLAGAHSLSHYIYRYNIIYTKGGEEVLAQNSITKCDSTSRAFGEYSSYIGATFHLRQGDEVFVKVSNLTTISRGIKNNYFGMFML